MNSKYLSINLVGDVMLGRLIDQLLPTHVDEPSEQSLVSSFKSSRPSLSQYTYKAPWGDTLALFHQASLNIINLETPVTSSSKKWPEKIFNYRMHPDNLQALKPPNIAYVSLANNHTLGFSEGGLQDTVDSLRKARIAFAGAGLSAEEAQAPVSLDLGNGEHVL